MINSMRMGRSVHAAHSGRCLSVSEEDDKAMSMEPSEPPSELQECASSSSLLQLSATTTDNAEPPLIPMMTFDLETAGNL